MDHISIDMPKVRSENRDSGMIPGGKKRGKEINRRQRGEKRERGKSMVSFSPVNCILLFAEDSREGISEGRGGNLPPVFRFPAYRPLSGPFILFLPLLMSFLCRVMIAGKE